MTRFFIVAGVIAMLGACESREPETWQGYVEGETLFIAAPVAGTLEELAVRPGRQVEADRVLFALEPEPDTTALRVARARAEVAAAELADLQKGSRPEELEVIEAQYAQAQAAVELSNRQLLRTRSLVERKLASQEALDEIETQHARDQKRLEELAAQLKTAQLAARTDQVDAAAARLRAAEAEVEQVQWRLDEKVQAAPVAGLIQDVLFRPGEFVPAGRAVVALLPAERIKIRFYVPQPQLGEIQENQRVAVRCDGCGDALTAEIRYISPRAEYTPPFIYSKENRAKFVYLVEAWPPVADAARLHPGQPVDVYWESAEASRP